uniref:Uncharacterized protein n=1 Tax=Hyaloperonospora arabidopsidis (strain Emoy2) TaxID=559515 RepID=M4BCC8_HYAAE
MQPTMSIFDLRRVLSIGRTGQDTDHWCCHGVVAKCIKRPEQLRNWSGRSWLRLGSSAIMVSEDDSIERIDQLSGSK